MTRVFPQLGWPFRRSLLFDSNRAAIIWRSVMVSDEGRQHPDTETLYRTPRGRFFLVSEARGRQHAVWCWKFEARRWLLSQTGPQLVLIERYFPGAVEPA